jgi:hypothetical protein
MTEDFFSSDDAFKSQLDAEALILMHMNRSAIYRDTDPKKYCSSVETLILICPRNIRDKALEKMDELHLVRGRYEAVTDTRLVVYDDLLVFIHEQLEKHKMIWKKRSIRTFE